MRKWLRIPATRIAILGVKNKDILVHLYMGMDGSDTLYRAIWRKKGIEAPRYVSFSKKFTFSEESKAIDSLGFETFQIKRDWTGV